MKRFILAAVFGVAGLFVVGAATGDDKKGENKKAGEKKLVGALPPHPLDSAFMKGNTEREITNNLLNHPLYETAVKEALKARREMEKKYRDTPNLAAATPAQAARQKFLEVLQNEPVVGKTGK